MLRQEKPNIKIENGFEDRKEFFIEIVREAVAEIDKSGENIGAGKTAEVKILEQDNTICLKIVDNLKTFRNKVYLKNKAGEEIEFLDKLSNREFLESIGIKEEKIVPKPMFSEEIGGRGFLFMERIRGFTFQDMFDKNLFGQLPAGFQAETFFQKLEVIVAKLNAARIFHRDLHDGNIFIDENGAPIIIDFGNAYESYLIDEDPYLDYGPRNEIIKFKSDPQCIKDLKEKFLLKYQNN